MLQTQAIDRASNPYLDALALPLHGKKKKGDLW